MSEPKLNIKGETSAKKTRSFFTFRVYTRFLIHQLLCIGNTSVKFFIR